MPRPCLSVTQVWDTWLTFETHINSLLLHFSLGSLRWNQSRHGNKSTSTHSGKLLLVKAMIVTTFAGKDTASQTLLHSSTLYRVPPSAASQVLPLIGSIVTVFSLTQTNSLVRVELQTLSDKTPAYFCSLLTVHTITWTLCSWSFMHLFILKVCTIFDSISFWFSDSKHLEYHPTNNKTHLIHQYIILVGDTVQNRCTGF